MSDYGTVRRLALALPGVEEGSCYGTPALRVRGKLLARLKEDGETLAVRCRHEERDLLLQAAPRVFFLTDHYRDYPWVLVRLPVIETGELQDLLERAWATVAPRKLVAEQERGAG
jgi:hypothetical protein